MQINWNKVVIRLLVGAFAGGLIGWALEASPDMTFALAVGSGLASAIAALFRRR